MPQQTPAKSNCNHLIRNLVRMTPSLQRTAVTVRISGLAHSTPQFDECLIDVTGACCSLDHSLGALPQQVEGGFAKVITLDAETTKKIFGKILPVVLGQIFGAASKAPADSPKALPDILDGARAEMESRQPKSGGIFNAIFDRNHDGRVDLADLGGLFGGK